jgi:SAM-dependent methyltransferase
MYTRSAEFYDALYAFKDYAKEAHLLIDLVRQRRPDAASLLDVACGTGKHLEVFRDCFRVEGLDNNPAFRARAERRCGVPVHQVDMRTFDLGRRFDVVTCLFSAVGNLLDAADLQRALTTMAAHVTANGLVIVEPWFTPETYWVDRVTVNLMDTAAYKGAWMYVSRREDCRSVLDIQYLVAGPDGIDNFSERHELGLFTTGQMVAAFRGAGLSVDHDPVGISGRGLYVGTPAGDRATATPR